MKKGESHIIAKAALGTYFFCMTTLVVLSLWAKNTDEHNRALQESINTAEDMIEWIDHDIEGEYVDSLRANTYIDNLNEVITDLEKIK